MAFLNKLLTILTMVISLVACTDADEATRVLGAAGYTDIEILGYAPFGCGVTHGNMSGWHTKFRAKGLNGQIVTGAVCSGVAKGATINLD